MQGHLSNIHALGADGIHQLRSEVQAGSGSSGAAQLLRVNGLVLALVLQLLCDVGRQRHFAEFVQLFIKRLCIVIKCNVLIAVFQRFVHHGGQGPVAEAHLRTGLHPLAGLCQAFPLVTLDLAQQQQLTHGTGGLLDAHDACRQHLGVIHHQQVARLQVIRQVVEDLVLDAVVFLTQNHQPCRVAGVCRFLRNKLFG